MSQQHRNGNSKQLAKHASGKDATGGWWQTSPGEARNAGTSEQTAKSNPTRAGSRLFQVFPECIFAEPPAEPLPPHAPRSCGGNGTVRPWRNPGTKVLLAPIRDPSKTPSHPTATRPLPNCMSALQASEPAPLVNVEPETSSGMMFQLELDPWTPSWTFKAGLGEYPPTSCPYPEVGLVSANCK